MITPSVGKWIYYCCDIDLHKIDSQEEVDELILDMEQQIEEDGYTPWRIHSDKVSALQEILPAYIYYPQEQERIKREIEDLGKSDEATTQGDKPAN